MRKANEEANATIAAAKAQADSIVNAANEQAERTIEDSRMRSDEAIEKANRWSAEIRIAAGDFIEDIMQTADNAITNSLTEIRNARMSLQSVTSRSPGLESDEQ